jgi:hypothetical protein
MALIVCPDCQKEISARAPVCVHCGCPNQAASGSHVLVAEQVPSGVPQTGSKHVSGWVVGVTFLALFPAVAIVSWLMTSAPWRGRATSSPGAEMTPTVETPALPAPKPTPSKADRLMAATRASDAFDIALPDMKDKYADIDLGTAMFSIWASGKMQWSDLIISADETTPGLVRKEPDSERGKRMCSSGSIVEIHAASKPGVSMSEGLLLGHSGNLYRFIAVGSSGSLVQNSEARFCGYVTGLYDYPNSGGGTGHAIKQVGMFDLPENHGNRFL